MTYNKSEIMKAAWTFYRTGHFRAFTFALRKAWSEAKQLVADVRKGLTPVSQINVGDTLALEYGDYGNHMTCVVTYIKPCEDLPGRVQIGCGGTIEICVRANGTVNRVAVAESVAA